MKRLVLTTALLLISASAYAGTYNFEGVTVNLKDGCRSASCVAVNAPGYGSYNGKAFSAKDSVKVGSGKAHKFHKDTTRFASTTKTDATPAAPATDATPAKLPEPEPQPAASTPAPAN